MDEIKNNITKYKDAMDFRREQDIELVKKFPFIEGNLLGRRNIEKKLNEYRNKLSEFPNIPGKFLELPNDCYYEIARYFKKLDQFTTFSLVSKNIDLKKYKFENVLLKCIKLSYVEYGDDDDLMYYRCNLDHGQIKITEYYWKDIEVIYQDGRICARELYEFKMTSIINIIKTVKNFNTPVTNIIVYKYFHDENIEEILNCLKKHNISININIHKYAIKTKYTTDLIYDNFDRIEIHNLAKYIPIKQTSDIDWIKI